MTEQMESPPATSDPERHRLKCPRCQSTNIRRSVAKTPSEKLVRYLTPFHYYRCRKCGHRGTHLGRVPHRHVDANDKTPGRPVERRDLDEVLERRKRALWSVFLAVVLGTVAGIYVHGCQQRAEQATPTE